MRSTKRRLSKDRSSGAPGEALSLTARTLRGAGWLTLSTIGMAAIRIGVIAIMARLLAPSDFGIMGAAGIFIEFARLLSASGIIQPLVQRESLDHHQIETAFTANLVSGLVSTLLICIAARPVARMFHMPMLEPVLYACSALFPIIAISAVSTKLLQREHDFAKIATSDMTSYFFSSVMVGIPMAYFGYGVWSLVLPTLIAALVRSIVLFAAQPHRLRLRIRKSAYIGLMRDGTGYSIQRFANLLSLKGDYFVVGSVLGPTALGQYERAYVLMNLSNTLVMSTLNSVLFPAFSRINHDPARMRAAFLRSGAMTALLFVPASVFATLLAPEIVRVLLGRQWSQTVIPFQILAIGMFFRTSYRVSGIILNSLGMVYRGTFAQSMYALIVIAGAYLLVGHGIVGVAFSTLIALVVVYLMLTFFAARAIGVTLRDLVSTVAPGILIAVITAAVATLVASPLRALSAAPLFVIFATASAVVVAVALIVLIRPAVIGDHTLSFLAPMIRKGHGFLIARRLPTRWLKPLLIATGR